MVDGFLSIIPRDLFTPFMEANTPQLLLMSFVAGLSIVVLGRKTKELQLVIRQTNLAGMQVARWIRWIIPYFSAMMAVEIILTDYLKDLLILVPVLLVSLVISVICMGAVLLYTSRKWKVSPRLLMRKCWPSFKMTLKTGSLDASYDLSQHCCTRELGIDRDFLMLALIYEIIYGIFASASNQFFVQMELTLQAGKLGLLKEDVLRTP